MSIIAPTWSIKRLKQAFEKGMKTQAELESVRDRLNKLFDAVSDCLWVYHKGQLFMSNQAAKRVMNELGEQQPAFRRKVYDCGMRVLSGVPEQVYEPDSESGKILLMVQSCVPVKMEDKNMYLVSAVNLSQALRNSEDIEHLTVSERKRIARDLHDGLSQLLASLSFQAKAISLKHEDKPQGEELKKIAEQAQRCVQLGAELYHDFDNI